MFNIELLSTLPLFDGLVEAELETIAHRLGWRTFGQGVFVFHQGGPGRTLYVIKSGKVRSFVTSDLGREITMDILGPGQVFGLLAALDDRPRATGIQIVELAVVLTLERQDLLPLMDEIPRLKKNVDELLATRLRDTLACFQDLAFHDVKGRVAGRLLTLADRFCPSSNDDAGDRSTTAWLPSQQELANWAAASRESTNRVLGTLRDEGLIQVEGDKITILDRRRLEGQIWY